jgi:membrane protease YdiL (CAAX protease family)
MLGGSGPSIAGIIMIHWNTSREARRDFWKRVIDFRRISLGWYLFIFLIFPALYTISFLLNTLAGNPAPEFETLTQIGANPLVLVGTVVIGIVAGPLSEELGWRGFALDRLQARWSPLITNLILAFFWWAWHLPLFFIHGTIQNEWGFGTLSFWLFLVGIIPLSMLTNWAYNRNGRSILAAILLHFTYNFVLALVFPFSVFVYFLLTVMLIITALIIRIWRR